MESGERLVASMERVGSSSQREEEIASIGMTIKSNKDKNKSFDVQNPSTLVVLLLDASSTRFFRYYSLPSW